MPIYGFKCGTCGHVFDKLQKLSEDNPACPLCAKQTDKQLTAPGVFDLRGGGYYVTDFRSKPK